MRRGWRAVAVTFIVPVTLAAVDWGDWPQQAWTPEDGLAVPVAEFSITQVSLLTALQILDNECGLIFGFGSTAPLGTQQPRIDLHLRYTTVRQIIAELQEQAPGFDFEMIDGVVTVAPETPAGPVMALLNEHVGSFEAVDLPPADVKARIRDLLKSVKGLEQLPIASVVRGELEKPITNLRIEDERLVVVLARAAASIRQSWIFVHLPDMARATFGMGRGWGLRSNTRYTLRLAPDAPKEPLPSELPPSEVVRERVQSAVLNARLTLHDRDAVVGELTALVDDIWARRNGGPALADAIRLIGDLRAEGAAPVLARNIDAFGDPYYRRWMKGQPGEGMVTDTAAGHEEEPARVFERWLRGFPALDALERIGLPAVPIIIDTLATHQTQPLPGALTGSTNPEECEAKTILLCAALEQILGADAAADRLRAAAAEEEDDARAQGLREAAERISKGLSPTLQ